MGEAWEAGTSCFRLVIRYSKPYYQLHNHTEMIVAVIICRRLAKRICPYQSFRRFSPSIFSFRFFRRGPTLLNTPTRRVAREKGTTKKKRKKRGEDRAMGWSAGSCCTRIGGGANWIRVTSRRLVLRRVGKMDSSQILICYAQHISPLQTPSTTN